MSCHYKSLRRVRANNTMSTLDGAAGSVSQGSICLLDALLLLIAFASHVAQTSIWMSGMKKINAYYIKYVIKALREVNPGNSTFQRQCACTMGYHWNEDCDCCQRNTVCAPGLGVKPPVQQDRDTMCIPCPRGYFSKVFSSTDECKSWTNCTALGLEESVPGTDKSDAVCKERKMPEPSEDGTNRILYVLIVILFFVTLIGIVIFIVYYKKKGKKLTADLQNWANEVCSQIKGTKEPSRDAFVSVNITNAAVPQTAEDTSLLVPSGSPVPGNSCCTSGHSPCRNESPSTEPCETGEFSMVTETDDYQFPPVPTEDEYMDKDLNNTDYLSFLSRTASKTMSSFSEPMEAGENDSLNQYFSGNVTGNSNSTFISSGQVMNFKGDIIVVYLSQNSQEGAAASGLSEENVGSPVQEENLSRCETFAGNAQHYKEKCAELQGARPAPGSGGPRWPGGALAQERGPSCGGQASQPVQEEGKLGHFSEKVLN
ncbi:hypothetical protein IHE44_0000698 [Lamprotornis superbus]|uniref:TNFR-Cys domain-containing protein n=1 Tax=Lamprotornis superbus TaxID=245042 RepID=A0A835NEF4_9PASS|nr:hypothetical protein IHE44_0000698 [Lamprotornis superbus]